MTFFILFLIQIALFLFGLFAIALILIAIWRSMKAIESSARSLATIAQVLGRTKSKAEWAPLSDHEL